jgi:hypothetical protein
MFVEIASSEKHPPRKFSKIYYWYQLVTKMNIYLELGKKKTVAYAVDHLGYFRVAKTEEEVLEALLIYGERYAKLMHAGGINFSAPTSLADFNIVKQYAGNATTDFGSPGIIPDEDKRPISAADAEQYEKLLRACWEAFDKAIASAEGKELKTGPRGGGRDLQKIITHVRDSNLAYLGKQGQKVPKQLREDRGAIRIAILETLTIALEGGIPAKGPRGGVMWPTPYFVRSLVGHMVDHIWEIEDRILD